MDQPAHCAQCRRIPSATPLTRTGTWFRTAWTPTALPLTRNGAGRATADSSRARAFTIQPAFLDAPRRPLSYDLPMFSGFDAATHWLANVCNSRSGLTGHHNWFDVTYTGSVHWVTHDGPTFGDDDYNMRLVTPQFHTDPAGTTFYNQSSFNDGNEVDIGLEFDSDETIDHFDDALFWIGFHQTVDNCFLPDCSNDTDAGNIINGHDAVVTGLMGIDEVHNGYTEIHPVHVLAIRESAPGSPELANDYWAFFVRNWGDEGECSSQQHYLLDNQVTIQLSPPEPIFQPKATLNSDTQALGSGPMARPASTRVRKVRSLLSTCRQGIKTGLRSANLT